MVAEDKSLSNPILPINWELIKVKPVILQPGRDRLCTNPKPTGSLNSAQCATMGVLLATVWLLLSPALLRILSTLLSCTAVLQAPLLSLLSIRPR